MVETRVFPSDYFGHSSHGSESEYQELFRAASLRSFPESDSIEESLGFPVDKKWVNNLVLHSQVVRKPGLNWQHGRVL